MKKPSHTGPSYVEYDCISVPDLLSSLVII